MGTANGEGAAAVAVLVVGHTGFAIFCIMKEQWQQKQWRKEQGEQWRQPRM